MTMAADLPIPATTAASPDLERTVAAKLGSLDRPAATFARQGAFVTLDDFLPADVTAQLVAAAHALLPQANRNYLPGHKKGASVSRHVIDRDAPAIAALYRSKALLAFLEKTCGEALQPCPPDDPHAYALYYYTKAGDHIGWHYDTSYYDGRRYTILLGVVDDSSCRLDYELHTRDEGRAVETGTYRIPPGGLVFFDGDRLRHRITPSAEGELRVSLTFEYVTDPGMRPWRRLISNLKDAIAYFGFRQLLRGGAGPR
jgi:alkylated DNA repair dioxygenase AlkB